MPELSQTYPKALRLSKMIRFGPQGRQRVITIPIELARLISDDQVFQAELTSEGLLFRAAVAVSAVVPDWTKNGARKAALNEV